MCFHSGAHKKVGYLNLTAIHQSEINIPMGQHELKGKTKIQQKVIQKVFVQNARDVASAYIGRAT